MITLLIATRNAHKIVEIRTILGQGFCYLTLNDIPDSPDVVEDAGTFSGNATKKAVALAQGLNRARAAEGGVRIEGAKADTPGQMYVLADDSGLEVDALGGAPGVHSARFAALDTGEPGNSPTDQNNAKLLRLLKGVTAPGRTARFRCVVALTPACLATSETSSPVCHPNKFEAQTELFEGACEGRIGFEPRGCGGFGYDPLFIPAGYGQTFAELGEDVKNTLSHRAKALVKVKLRLCT